MKPGIEKLSRRHAVEGFGTDADGEAYVLTSSPTGQGVFRLVPAARKNPPT